MSDVRLLLLGFMRYCHARNDFNPVAPRDHWHTQFQRLQKFISITFWNFFFSFNSILRAVSGHSKTKRMVQRDPIYPPPPNKHSLPHYHCPPPERVVCYNWWPTLAYHYPGSPAYVKFTLCVIYSVGLGKYIMACIHNYSIIQSSFTALKILCLFISPCTLTLGTFFLWIINYHHTFRFFT